MGRRSRKQDGIDAWLELAARLPWWFSLVLALVCYLLLSSISSVDIRQGLAGKPIGQVMTQQVVIALAIVGQYVLPMLLAFGAITNLGRKFKRGRLFHWASMGDRAQAMSQMGWQEFELLIGEAFRRRGYRVREMGQSGNDGGIDLVLEKDGAVTVVQCKHWKAFKVGVDVVRAYLGVMIHAEADNGIIVTSGRFTHEARSFAGCHHIELIDGRGLKSLLKPAVDKDSVSDTAYRAFDRLFVNGQKALRWHASADMFTLLICLALIGGGIWVFVDQVGTFSERLMARASTAKIGSVPDRTTMTGSDQSAPADAAVINTGPPQAPMAAARDSGQSAAYHTFEAQYQQPEDCLIWRDDQHMVDCTNHYIRARSAFMRQYESAKATGAR